MSEILRPIAILVMIAGCALFIVQGKLAFGASASDIKPAGRAVAELIRSRDGAALERKFTPQMAAAVPIGPLQQLLNDTITTDNPLGARIKESIDRTNGLVTYTAEHAWRQGQDLAIIVNFVPGSGGKITGLRLKVVPAGELLPDPHAGYQLKAHLRLPFEPGNTWFVFWGGDTRALNYHVDYPDQRHAYDILIMRDGSSHDGDGTKLDQYYAWGKHIVAPADGTIIETENGLPDNPIGVMDPSHAAGNHVVIDLGNGEYAMIAHMQHGSIQVKRGDRVATGQWLGLCGNSGNTSEPHIHIHVQDKPQLFKPGVHGLPVEFRDFVRNGKTIEIGSPVKGDEIAAAALSH